MPPKTSPTTTANPTPRAACTVVRCAVPVPLIKLLDYLHPGENDTALHPGQRVRVPLGRREVIAVVVECVSQSDIEIGKLKAIAQIIDPEPLIDPLLLRLLLWASNYYLHPPGEVLPLGLSPASDAASHRRAPALRALGLMHEAWLTPRRFIAGKKASPATRAVTGATAQLCRASGKGHFPCGCARVNCQRFSRTV